MNIANTLQYLSDKHAPVKKTTNRIKRILKKPWITKGILNSIKNRHKLFKSHYLSNDPEKIKQYKSFNNCLNKIKAKVKNEYLNTQFALNKSNIKATWKMIDMIASRNKKKKLILSKLLYNGKCYTDKENICNKLNEYFVNVGPNLSSKLPTNPDFRHLLTISNEASSRVLCLEQFVLKKSQT